MTPLTGLPHAFPSTSVAEDQLDVQEHQIAAHEQLYQDAIRRRLRQEEMTHWYPEDFTFQPTLQSGGQHLDSTKVMPDPVLSVSDRSVLLPLTPSSVCAHVCLCSGPSHCGVSVLMPFRLVFKWPKVQSRLPDCNVATDHADAVIFWHAPHSPPPPPPPLPRPCPSFTFWGTLACATCLQPLHLSPPFITPRPHTPHPPAPPQASICPVSPAVNQPYSNFAT